MEHTLPLTRDLVLIGGGHTHALVLRKWAMNPLAGARLTVINPGPTAPYTGMLPGFVAGHYSRDELDIDLVQLSRFAGARLILGPATGIDLNAKQIHVPDRPPIAYDIASINVGITSDLPDLPGFKDHAIAAKPLGIFAQRWDAFRQLCETSNTRPQIAVIGGGVGGVELSLAMAHALRAFKPEITVIQATKALPALASAARNAMLAQMTAQGVTMVENTRPTKVTAHAVHLDNGQQIASTFTVGVAGARPLPWLQQTGLDLDAGFIKVSAHLQTSDPSVFAAGDCVALPDARPKAGVFAVREASVLVENLLVALSEKGKLRAFRPQKDFLKLISLGEKSAVADKWGGRARGAWAWRWKDWIDRKFMTQFENLPAMTTAFIPSTHAAGLTEALGDKPMCGGCGAKVGADILSGPLAALPASTRGDIVRLPGDDAALLQIGGQNQVLTTDHLRALTLDPYVMAKIAANHALGDIWAMGAAPQAVLATIILPRLSETLQSRWLSEIMAGIQSITSIANAEIIGGHTSIGSELTIGLSATGLLDQAPITLAGAQPGDRLVLTKPIGSGVLMAAEMQMKARGDWVEAALSHMTTPQADAATALGTAHAMTDVTGFGLAGHLMNICKSSNVGAALTLEHIPTLPGAIELATQGIRSSLFPSNARLTAQMTLPNTPKADLLFDPQTAGGLLAAIAPENAEETIKQLSSKGIPACDIGQITEGPAFITVR